MSPTIERRSEKSALDIVRIDDQKLEAVYVLYPADATDEELKTKWIRFQEGDYADLAEMR